MKTLGFIVAVIGCLQFGLVAIMKNRRGVRPFGSWYETTKIEGIIMALGLLLIVVGYALLYG